MIILYSKNFNYNFSTVLKNYNNSYLFSYLICPNCNSNNFINWGSYSRTLYFLENNNIISKIIKIKRVKCKDCGHTHALLPSFIVPYKIHSLDIILDTLSNNANTINYETFFMWHKQFNKFIPFLSTMFNLKKKKKIIKLLKINIFKYYKLFFERNKKILMMNHPGIFNMVPF